MAKDSAGNKLPWMKLWTRDLMSEPSIQVLNWDKRGRYFWGLMCSWHSDEPGVAYESEWAAWMGYSMESWESVRDQFAPLFKKSDHPSGEPWTQARLRLEASEARIESDKKHLASIKANKVRWESGRNPVGVRTESPAVAEAVAVPEESRTKPPRSANASLWDTLLRMELPDFLPREAWTDFVNHRRSLGVKGKLTERAARLTISELQGLNDSGHPPGPVISQSVTNNWKGVFPIKNGVPNAPAEAKPKTKRWTCDICGKSGFSDDGGPDFRTCDSCMEAMNAR